MTTDRDIEKTLDVTAFVAELRRLADALEADAGFDIELDGETVQVPANAIFSVEHEREGGREELEFQLKWGEAEDEEDESEEAEEEEPATGDKADADQAGEDTEAEAAEEPATEDGATEEAAKA